MRRAGTLAWAVAACALGALWGAGTAGAAPYSANVTISPAPITAPIPDGFVGLAFEYSDLPQWAGGAGGPVNPVLVRLIRNLDPVGRPIIRIGGLSTDHSWWPVAGVTPSPGLLYALTPAWTASARGLAQATDAQLILGINLEANSLRLSQVEAAELATQIGRRYIGAFDIGNEPPLYTSIPWYHVLNGRVLPWYDNEGSVVLSRGSTWGPLTFTNEYARVVDVLPKGVPIAGPDTQQASWFAAFVRLLTPHSRVRMLMSHGYGLNSCVKKPASAAYPSVPHLLGPYASNHLLPGLLRYIQLAHQNGATFRIDEMGSITCNGRWGVSNTMASALWAAAALFTVAQDHADGVNLHSFPGLSNTPFDFTQTSSGWTGAVHPLYYGALLFAHAAPAGSRLLTVGATGPTGFHAWATAGPGPVARVLLINDSLGSAATVVVTPQSGYGSAPAQLEALTAPSAHATTGITLGGRSFGAATSAGALQPPIADTVRPRAGSYRVRLPQASALLLTFSRRP